jgi:hypothetical protein
MPFSPSNKEQSSIEEVKLTALFERCVVPIKAAATKRDDEHSGWIPVK